MARISYTEKEVELLARLIKSEALGEGEEGMLLVGNVVVNRVVANCDIFRNVRTLSEVRCINGYRNEPATNALWFKNPGTNVECPETFFGRFSGRYKKHCFYNLGLKDNCDL